MSTVGSGQYRYEVIEDWAKLPKGWQFGILVGVAVDSQDRVYVCHQRQDPPIIVFDRDGNYLSSWGTDEINEGHIMTIAPDDSMYLVDRGAHQALHLRLDGERLMELGRKGYPSNTGVTVIGGEPQRAAGPFNMPTRMFCAPSGDIYVSDGYRNARVHRFSSDGELVKSWGKPGKRGRGDFYLPHSLWVDSAGLIYVCDRKNNRVQVFTQDGSFIGKWDGLIEPVDICMDSDENVFVHEGGVNNESPRITVLDKSGKVQARWNTPYGHQIWVDTHGDIYMAVCWEQRIQKFVRQG